MLRVFFSFGLALVTGLSLYSAGALANDAKTIRIEPRPFYGATISLEAGVRVFRPLPRTTHMIINPNRTPLHLTIKDITKTVHTTKTVTHRSIGGTSHGVRSVGLPYGYGFRRGGRGKRGR